MAHQTSLQSHATYNIYTGSVSHVSAKAGLLALSWVFRSLGLHEAIREHLGGDDDTLSCRLEALLMLQACGADCVADSPLLNDDPCLVQGLGFSAPSRQVARSTLESLLSKSVRPPASPQAFEEVLAHSAARAWAAYKRDRSRELAFERHVTIDVLTFTQPGITSPHLWLRGHTGELPCRVICYWREGGLILSGGMCQNEASLIHCIAAALNAVPESRFGRLIRAGPICDSPEITSWLVGLETESQVRVGSGMHSKKVSVGVMVGTRSANAASIGDARAEKEARGQACIQWNGNEMLLSFGASDSCLRRVILKWKTADSYTEKYSEAGFVTNRRRNLRSLGKIFLKGTSQLVGVCSDVLALAFGSRPEALAETTGEGRFLMALLNYNICATIRMNCIDGPDRHASITRLREMLIHTAGHIAKTEGSYYLKLSQPEAKAIFLKIRRRFPLKQRPTVKTSELRKASVKCAAVPAVVANVRNLD